MALRRPAEITWNFKKPPEPFPQTPGANGCFLAPSGMGKTTTLIAMLLGPYKGIFDQIHVFSPSVDIDSAWLPVKELAKNLMEGSTFNNEWDEPALRKILDAQREKIKDLKHAKWKKPLPQILTIIDDFADRSDMSLLSALCDRHAGLHETHRILTLIRIKGGGWWREAACHNVKPVVEVHLPRKKI